MKVVVLGIEISEFGLQGFVFLVDSSVVVEQLLGVVALPEDGMGQGRGELV